MTRYHMNPATGNPNKCSAKEGNCPFKSDDGTEATHYESREEAAIGYEKEMAAKQDAERKRRAEAAEANWPTPSAERIAAFEAKGYRVDPKGKGLMIRGEHNGRNWDITVRSGIINASLSHKSSFGSALRISTKLPLNSEDSATQELEFGDFGTSFSIEQAEDHVKSIESVLEQAPTFVRRANKALVDAEALFGKPKSGDPIKGLYASIDVPSTFTGTRDGKTSSFTVEGQPGYFNIRSNSQGRLDTRRDSDADVYVDGFGEVHTRVSLSSFGSMDRDEYQARAERLKDSIATAKAMEATAKALPKKPVS